MKAQNGYDNTENESAPPTLTRREFEYSCADVSPLQVNERLVCLRARMHIRIPEEKRMDTAHEEFAARDTLEMPDLRVDSELCGYEVYRAQLSPTHHLNRETIQEKSGHEKVDLSRKPVPNSQAGGR